MGPSLGRTGAYGAVLALLAVLLSISPLSAKDWDLDRGKYLTDLEIYLLAGPVQSVTTTYYQPGSNEMYQLTRWEFDRAGNLLESRTITFASSCSKQVYTYNAFGHRLSLQSFSTQEQPLPLVGKDDCRFPQATEYATFSYSFDSRSQMTSRTKTLFAQSYPAVTEEFRHDLLGNLSEQLWLVGARKDLLYRNRYSYENSRSGRRVFRQANYYEDQSAVDVRIVTTMDTKGRVLTYRKNPPEAAGFYNDYDNTYDVTGNLKSSGSGESRIEYSGHDLLGNWTRSTSSQQTASRSIQYFR